jgi:hypothetical protein
MNMFIDKMREALNDEFNVCTTENGALGYRTTGNALLDLNFQVASMRTSDPSHIIAVFMKAFYEDKQLAVKWLFYVRDAREGIGERRLFRILAGYLCDNEPDVLKDLICYIPEYGRYDDLWCLLETQHSNVVIEIIQTQLAEDLLNMKDYKPISLLAKWLPSANTSSRETVRMAKQIIRLLGMNESCYRKMLSKMRRYIDVVEVKMSARQWRHIQYEAVPSRANLIYRNAFLQNDKKRRLSFLESLEKGETKINASVLFPHDIVHNYNNYKLQNKDATLEELWNALPDTMDGCSNTIVVADGSGSMTATVGGTGVTALSVANALAIYFSERSSGQFKDNYITFSTRPKLVSFSQCKSLRDKIIMALRHNEAADTNIEAVFELILKTAVMQKMKQSELPQTILIISDMEFNSAIDEDVNLNERLFEIIDESYSRNGYKLPRLVFWNVNSRTGTVPVVENELGVALVSGFSVNVIKMVLSGNLDPYECLRAQLMSERYEKIAV